MFQLTALLTLGTTEGMNAGDEALLEQDRAEGTNSRRLTTWCIVWFYFLAIVRPLSVENALVPSRFLEDNRLSVKFDISHVTEQ